MNIHAARLAGRGLTWRVQLVRLHSGGEYRVHFIGFTGGFPYLGGLPTELATVPRLSTPRQLVPKGSIGIAAGQTGAHIPRWRLVQGTGTSV